MNGAREVHERGGRPPPCPERPGPEPPWLGAAPGARARSLAAARRALAAGTAAARTGARALTTRAAASTGRRTRRRAAFGDDLDLGAFGQLVDAFEHDLRLRRQAVRHRDALAFGRSERDPLDRDRGLLAAA